MEIIKPALEILVLVASLGAIVFQAGASHARGKVMAGQMEELKSMVKGWMDRCSNCRDELDHEDRNQRDDVAVMSVQLARVEENLKLSGRS